MNITQDKWLGELLGKPAFHLLKNFQVNSAEDCFHDLPSDAFYDHKVPCDDIQSLHYWIGKGLYPVDVNLYFELEISGLNSSNDISGVRKAVDEDVYITEEIAFKFLNTSRFSLDPNIEDHVAAEIKRAWVGNFFRGKRGEVMLVVEKDGEVVGFNQIIKGSENNWIIDLIALDSKAWGQGLAKKLVFAMKENCPGIKIIGVGTQVSNTQAIRFYEKLGFKLVKSSWVLHGHKGLSL